MSARRLSEFFAPHEVLRDSVFAWTLHPKAKKADALCYALNEATVLRINRNPHVTAVLTTALLAPLVACEKGVVVPASPQRAYYDLHNTLVRDGSMKVHHDCEIHPTAKISASAVLGREVVIGAGVTIGHGAVIGDFTIIGDETCVETYAVIGARGMQNTKVNGSFYRVEWAGGVRIGRRCEILTAAIIQRPYHCEYTEIGDEARISVKTNIGHGAHVGVATMIGGNAQVAGNAWIGDHVWVGQSSTICDGVRVGHNAEIKMGSVVVRHVGDGEIVSGNFAHAHEQHVQSYIKRKNA